MGLKRNGAGDGAMNDRDYFLERALQEEEAALAASSLSARWRHEELAGLYRLRAARIERESSDASPAEVGPAFILPSASPEIEAA